MRLKTQQHHKSTTFNKRNMRKRNISRIGRVETFHNRKVVDGYCCFRGCPLLTASRRNITIQLNGQHFNTGISRNAARRVVANWKQFRLDHMNIIRTRKQPSTLIHMKCLHNRMVKNK